MVVVTQVIRTLCIVWLGPVLWCAMVVTSAWRARTSKHGSWSCIIMLENILWLSKRTVNSSQVQVIISSLLTFLMNWSIYLYGIKQISMWFGRTSLWSSAAMVVMMMMRRARCLNITIMSPTNIKNNVKKIIGESHKSSFTFFPVVDLRSRHRYTMGFIIQ